MAGTTQGGKQAAKTNKHKYDEQYLKEYGLTFYQYLGRLGGKAGNTGGFKDRELARRAGKIGGQISRRPKRKEQ